MLDPPRAGLTNSGQPSSVIASSTRLRSGSTASVALSTASGGQSRSRTTTCGPTGRPRAWKMIFMYSLSMLTALASTPAPTYGTPAISSRPWMVPSSPNGPCSIGSTTSTSSSRCGIWPGALAVTGRGSAHGTTCASGSTTASTDGSWPAVTPSLAGSSAASTQRPSRVMPTGMTSYLSRSIARSMLPPPMQDTACSGPLPPKMTATRILRWSFTLLPSVPPYVISRCMLRPPARAGVQTP